METKKIGVRRVQTVIIEEKAIEFKEISLDQLLALFGYKSFAEIIENKEIDKKKDESFLTYFLRINELLQMSTGMQFDDFKGLAPSQLKEVYTIFKEVNEVFFQTALLIMQGDITKVIKSLIIQEFVKLFAHFQQQATPNVLNTGSSSPVNVTKSLQTRNLRTLNKK